MSLGTAIIVGVGPGLGLALGRAFAEAGHSVALLARDKAKLDGYVAELASIGPEVRPYAADVTDEANLESAIATAILELGAPDLLVYNAGAVRMDKPTEGDAADLAYTLAVNVIGAKVAANAVRPALRDGRGSLLFTGGGLAHEPNAAYGTLSIGKAALRSYVQTLHEELAGTGIHATSVAIYGQIGGPEPRFNPDTLAKDYVQLHRQPETEWQHELLRP
jgi:NAD(P)-dependent dehydrogenase (short-subunit alcohol dehydrogenase family)